MGTLRELIFGKKEIAAAANTVAMPAPSTAEQNANDDQQAAVEYLDKQSALTAMWNSVNTGRSGRVVRALFNGERDFGEMGPAIYDEIDPFVLGLRSWQLFLRSETSHTIIKQKGKWVLGTGLRLDAAPKTEYLKSKGLEIEGEKFSKQLEEMWELTSTKNPMMDYAGRVPLSKIAKRIERNMSVWGYVLIVHRFGKNNVVTTQIIDGQWVNTPIGSITIGGSTKLVDNKVGYDWIWPETGNRIRNGVEISDTGEHVAYFVRNGIGLVYERIPAKNSMGLLMAYICYGEEFRLDNTFGIPTITPNMQSSKQLDEYTDATVGSVKERAQIPYFFTHDKGTAATNPMQTGMAKILGNRGNGGTLDIPVDVEGKALANTVAATTKKMVFNLPEGTDVKSPEFKQELAYSDFHSTRFNADCATIGIPPEVASQLYGSSYSASRAATNGWQYMLNIDRDDFGDQFYQRVYNLQLWVWIFSGEIQAPGYIDAFYKGNEMIIAAYQYAHWQGDPVPQIDELKEIQAARLKLGLDSANVPLSTFEQECQRLGLGDFSNILKQYLVERKTAIDGGIQNILPKGATDEPAAGSEDATKKKDKGKDKNK